MKIFEALDREIFRPLATIILPGAAALVPYAFILGLSNPAIVSFAKSDTTLASLILLFVAMTVGLLLGDLGSWVESHWDKRLEKKNGTHENVWFKYLTLTYKPDEEPIGQQYIRTVLLLLKFELSFGVGTVIAIPGIIWLGYRRALSYRVTISAIMLALLLSIYLLRESWDSARVLARVRAELVKAAERTQSVEDEIETSG